MKDLVSQRFREAVAHLINSEAEDKIELRNKLGIIQSRFSEIMSGKRDPKIEYIINLCNNYGVSFDWIFNGKGEMFVRDVPYVMEPHVLYERSHDALLIEEEREPEVLENKNGNRYFIYPDGTIKVEVLQVPFPAYATFLEAYNDEDRLYTEFGKTFFSVDHVGRGNYLGFIVKGDSMNGGNLYDTPDKAEVLGREVQRHLWSGDFHKTEYGFILLTKSAIYHKDIKKFNQITGMLTLASRNPDYEDFSISINDVYKIFNVIKRTY